MMRFIDSILNRITMYRLVLYELLMLLGVAVLFGAFHFLPYSPLYIAYSAILIFAVTWITNEIFALAFDAPSNPESTYITALILALIISPPQAFWDPHYFMLAGWAAALAAASKYIFAIRHKHLFNPAAFGVALPALTLGVGASWWVGTLSMLPFVTVGGFLVARKIRRLDLVLAFGASVVVTILFLSAGEGSGALHIVKQALLYSPAVFLGTVMLTEPLTMPPGRFNRVWYAVLVGFLFAPEVHIGTFYFTPELALLAGNIVAYVMSPKGKHTLTLVDRVRTSSGTYEFVFQPDEHFAFSAGQYLEWTLPHQHADSRGIRRYFTIASAPSDPFIRLGVKFYDPMSTYKGRLLAMKKGDIIIASQVAGDFVLPSDSGRKLAFIAGGIGITPFRSMLNELRARGEKRDIVLLYSNRSRQETPYLADLAEAESELGIQVVPVYTDTEGQLTPALIARYIPDYQERFFYLSGPQGMVTGFDRMLRSIGVSWHRIKKDYFPGFA
ncbi:MAG: ferredoxin--NADP reductase [Bacillota bacterium]